MKQEMGSLSPVLSQKHLWPQVNDLVSLGLKCLICKMQRLPTQVITPKSKNSILLIGGKKNTMFPENEILSSIFKNIDFLTYSNLITDP